MESSEKKAYVESLLKKNILLSPDFDEGADITELQPNQDMLILNHETNKILSSKAQGINWKEIDKMRVMYEKGLSALPSIDDITAVAKKDEESDMKVIHSYKSNPQTLTVKHFADHFATRYKLIEKILRARQELQNLTAIKRLSERADTNNLSIIGIVSDKHETKSKNILLTIEDQTGSARVIISRNRQDLFESAREVVLDEVIGITGHFRKGFLLTNNIVFPDIPEQELKKSPEEEYAAFMSDLHFGSKQFMEEEFNRFLSWVNQETGNEKQKKIASKLKYILIAGDIVDGAGIYQTQQSELTIKDIREQYAKCAEYLSRIPSSIKIIMSPGNHDAVRISEPQPPLDNQFTTPLKKLKNLTLLSNPATVKIGIKPNFPGFTCLLYHGYSFDHYVANIDSIRQNGGYERADLIMKFLLKRRHLAPTHASTLITPNPEYDALFIEPVPDFFVTGHIHRTAVSNYKSTTLISGSCWQSMTSFQERLGHNPQPARLPAINLNTRDATIINFMRQ